MTILSIRVETNGQSFLTIPIGLTRSQRDNKRVVLKSFKGYSPYVLVDSKLPAKIIRCSFTNTNMDNDPSLFHFTVKNGTSQCYATPSVKIAVLRRSQETYTMHLECTSTERLPSYVELEFELFE